MKRFLVILPLFLAFWGARAEGPDDQYIAIYNLIQEADKLNSGGRSSEALSNYLQAQTALQRFQRGYPDWNSRVVGFRLNYLADKIAALSARAPVPAAPVPSAVTSPGQPPSASPGQPVQPAAPSDWENQLSTLTDQVRQLQADKTVLEAKLKEALSVQPATVDPRELARAEARINDLLKENDLLKVSLDQEKTRPVATPDTKVLDEARQAVDEANRKLAELAGDKESLQTRVAALRVDAETAAALRTENQLLKKQVADLRAAPPAASRSEEEKRQLDQAQAQIAALQSDKEVLRLEKTALADRVKELSAATAVPAAASRAADAARIKELERERDDLKRSLAVANRELYSRKGKAAAARLASLEHQLATLRARLQVYEARQVPYTSEELALFQRPEPKLAQPARRASRTSVKELPAGTVALVVEAQRHYANREYDKAEEKYLQVLQQDRNNVPTLANLAAIELDLNHLDAAETNIMQAVALAPDDAFSQFVLGRLRFTQEKYDEALDALSRAAKLDPQDAQIQNFLGLALSEKGLRGPAETALRKAVQLDPSYANAHNNLAVIYVTQQPPLVELARWHYRKALAAGLSRNPNLEKMIEAKQAAAGAP